MTKAREASFENTQVMPEDFWQYAVGVYNSKRVKDICLHMQDTHNADVNMLLLCCWLDRQKTMIPQPLMQALNAESAHWQKNILRPVRERRRATDKKSPAYAEQLEHELSLEQDEQKALISILNETRSLDCTDVSHATKNIVAYGALIAVPDIELEKLIGAITAEV